MILGIIALLLIVLTFSYQPKDLFYGLKPKVTFGEYKIYDIVEQRNLACAEMIEILDSDEIYEYYFNCLRSDQIYFVSETEIIKVKTFYKAGLITKEQLYELKIIDRMLKVN